MPVFWKQFNNNQKSFSSDSLPLPSSTINKSPIKENENNNIFDSSFSQIPIESPIPISSVDKNYLSPPTTLPARRPPLALKFGSNNNVPTTPPSINTSKQQEEQNKYRSYRDNFISNRNGFTGGVFGVSLSQSLSVASAEVIVQSELVNFGRIPIVVAKCGAYLKANALDTPGIFRIAGNSKRVKELQYIFSRPPDYGTKFNQWEPYTVHDVASLLRRYLNNLEEPLIPLDLYDDFRSPLQDRPRILRHMMKKNKSDMSKNSSTVNHTLNAHSSKSKSIHSSSAISPAGQPSDLNQNSNNAKNQNLSNSTVQSHINHHNNESTDKKEPAIHRLELKDVPIITMTDKPHGEPKEILPAHSKPMRVKNSSGSGLSITSTEATISTEAASNQQALSSSMNELSSTSPTENMPPYTDDRENDGDEEEDDALLKERKGKRTHKKKKLTRDVKAAIKDYEALFVSLSNDTKQLTIYLLDLLSLFSRQSQFNLMPGSNLAAIFQPSFLFHPQHDMDPKEYELSRLVVEFLIEYSYKLLPHLLKLAKEEQLKTQETDRKISASSNIATSTNINAEERPESFTRVDPSGSPSKVLNSNDSPNRVIKNIIKDDPVSGRTSPIQAINIPRTMSPARITRTDSPLSISSSSLKNGEKQNLLAFPSDIPGIVQPSSVKENAANNISLTNLSQSIPKKFISPKKPIKTRPHSRSIGSVPNPPDVITSNKRRSKLFPWLHKPGILSDSGDLSVTEEEGEDLYDDENENENEVASLSPSTPTHDISTGLQYLPVQGMNRSLSSNSANFTFNGRPKATVIKPSVGTTETSISADSAIKTALLEGPENGHTRSRSFSGSENPTYMKSAKDSKQKKRESWFQRLRSPSRPVKK
ncbi:hypothetical protein TBLA_0A02560 [Henningerozyma blattae CBS 6284]|uniref:Rho-GAP domain-containing protein n=1 Tax=Henningerozyma blattae (strain ATCC 34711 / CBS 6284 / DSM 70876 / NBRC 10599 / NRRL Y-10934 / UCD 77-7) TaxID=1071380 RepID=I2GVA3_HENB6|nr:hypothetical protein TBLA_0A02560 [Tetrapisispora blattae CBS 6284]CCH58055.1 hypothetical protein TBLA_0A02560 [Tetrapisispora blattae CBS 6284]